MRNEDQRHLRVGCVMGVVHVRAADDGGQRVLVRFTWLHRILRYEGNPILLVVSQFYAVPVD